MKIIFMGRKPGAVKALEFLLGTGAKVLGVVCRKDIESLHWRERLYDFALKNGLPVLDDADLYSAVKGEMPLEIDISDVDVVISYLFWKRIKQPLIQLPKVGVINFHPAPLPDFRGVGGYNAAILEGLSYWGVSAHFIDEGFDTGDLIKVERFEIDAGKHTAFSLEQLTQGYLLRLFKEVISALLAGGRLSRRKQGEGRYISKSEFENLRRISEEDTPEAIDRKIRAFWYPPYPGAYIEKNGKKFLIANEFVLKEAGKFYHGAQ